MKYLKISLVINLLIFISAIYSGSGEFTQYSFYTQLGLFSINLKNKTFRDICFGISVGFILCLMLTDYLGHDKIFNPEIWVFTSVKGWIGILILLFSLFYIVNKEKN